MNTAVIYFYGQDRRWFDNILKIEDLLDCRHPEINTNRLKYASSGDQFFESAPGFSCLKTVF